MNLSIYSHLKNNYLLIHSQDGMQLFMTKDLQIFVSIKFT